MRLELLLLLALNACAGQVFDLSASSGGSDVNNGGDLPVPAPSLDSTSVSLRQDGVLLGAPLPCDEDGICRGKAELK